MRERAARPRRWGRPVDRHAAEVPGAFQDEPRRGRWETGWNAREAPRRMNQGTSNEVMATPQTVWPGETHCPPWSPGPLNEPLKVVGAAPLRLTVTT